MNREEWAQANTIHRVIAGSRLYGNNTTLSDYDYRGVCLMPPEALIGLQGFEQYQPSDSDTVIYALNKFFQLALDANPNIMDILYAPPEYWLIQSPIWEEIYNNKHLFISERVRYTFSGYAVAQLKRIQRHRHWIMDPPDHQPTAEEYDGWLEKGEKGGMKIVFHNTDDQKRYNTAQKHWKNYQTWLKERNPKRAELERRYGYDTKHGGHLVRLMTKVEGLLKTGTYTPVLDDFEWNMVNDVMMGDVEYEDLIAWAESTDKLIKEMPTVLQHSPDRVAAEKLLMRINKESLNA